MAASDDTTLEERRQAGRRKAQQSVAEERRLSDRRQQDIWEEFAPEEPGEAGRLQKLAETSDPWADMPDLPEPPAATSPTKTIGSHQSNFWDDMAEFTTDAAKATPEEAARLGGKAEDAKAWGYMARWANRGRALGSTLGKIGEAVADTPGVTTMGRLAGKAMVPVGLGMDAYTVYKAGQAGLGWRDAAKAAAAEKAGSEAKYGTIDRATTTRHIREGKITPYDKVITPDDRWAPQNQEGLDVAPIPAASGDDPVPIPNVEITPNDYYSPRDRYPMNI